MDVDVCVCARVYACLCFWEGTRRYAETEGGVDVDVCVSVPVFLGRNSSLC